MQHFPEEDTEGLFKSPLIANSSPLIYGKSMARTQIIKAPSTSWSHFGTSVRNTDISQRSTLEEVIVNLSTALGVAVVFKQVSARGGVYYEIQASGFTGYQSASNTILELSRQLALAENRNQLIEPA